jgi:hypothetical protein
MLARPLLVPATNVENVEARIEMAYCGCTTTTNQL